MAGEGEIGMRKLARRVSRFTLLGVVVGIAGLAALELTESKASPAPPPDTGESEGVEP